jgi:phenylalanyl-tRNA synthetase beta chain
MKFTLSWLKEHLETDATLDEIVEALNNVGLEVEEVTNPGETYKNFTVAEIIKADQHPNADKLKLCQVKTIEGEKSVVCGAPNARAGIKVVYAPIGAIIPATGDVLKKAKIRGIESQGMLCSVRELKFGEDHDGIAELDENAQVGEGLEKHFNLGEPVIEISVTPNRADALGVRGIARDLAATDLGKLIPKTKTALESQGTVDIPIRFELNENQKDWCPAFAVRLVRNVRNKPSPDWLKQKLEALGSKPISTLVDITNYSTFDRARPLHVFDADKVKGDIVVRAAKNSETFEGLDGKTYKLDESMCVIADDNGVISLSGIMGGMSTSVTEETTNVLIESALWDPYNIAKTGRTLGIISDARFRFERDVDPNDCLDGLDRAAALVQELCGGEVSERQLTGEIPERETMIIFATEEIDRLIGQTIEDFQIKRILSALGFNLVGMQSPYRVSVPTWRKDVTQQADLVEEVLRIYGINNIQSKRLEWDDEVKSQTPLSRKRIAQAKRVLINRGYKETLNWSFVDHTLAKAFGGGEDTLILDNPISSEMTTLRPSLLPGLLQVLDRNVRRGKRHLRLCEVSDVYLNDMPEGQETRAAGVVYGLSSLTQAGRDWVHTKSTPESQLYKLKADVLGLLESFRFNQMKLQPTTQDLPDYLHPGRSLKLNLGNKTIALFGELHPSFAKGFEFAEEVYLFEVNLSAIPAKKAKAKTTKPALNASELQPVRRDFAFTAPEEVSAHELIKRMQSADQNRITEIRLFDVFTPKDSSAENKPETSYAFEVTIDQGNATMDDKALQDLSEKIIQKAESAGAKLRS